MTLLGPGNYLRCVNCTQQTPSIAMLKWQIVKIYCATTMLLYYHVLSGVALRYFFFLKSYLLVSHSMIVFIQNNDSAVMMQLNTSNILYFNNVMGGIL